MELVIPFCIERSPIALHGSKPPTCSSQTPTGRRLPIAPNFRPRVPRCGHGCRSLGRTEIREGGHLHYANTMLALFKTRSVSGCVCFPPRTVTRQFMPTAQMGRLYRVHMSIGFNGGPQKMFIAGVMPVMDVRLFTVRRLLRHVAAGKGGDYRLVRRPYSWRSCPSVTICIRKRAASTRQLIAAIRRFKVYSHPLESTWFVETNLSPQQVYHYLKPYLHFRDKIVITPAAVEQGWWTQGLTPQNLSWLHAGLSPSVKATG